MPSPNDNRLNGFRFSQYKNPTSNPFITYMGMLPRWYYRPERTVIIDEVKRTGRLQTFTLGEAPSVSLLTSTDVRKRSREELERIVFDRRAEYREQKEREKQLERERNPMWGTPLEPPPSPPVLRYKQSNPVLNFYVPDAKRGYYVFQYSSVVLPNPKKPSPINHCAVSWAMGMAFMGMDPRPYLQPKPKPPKDSVVFRRPPWDDRTYIYNASQWHKLDDNTWWRYAS